MKGSRRYCGKRTSGSHASLTCGWTRATEERTRGRIGLRRRWAGAWMWWSARKSPPPKGADGVGEGMGQGGRGGGLAESIATRRLRGVASEMGGGADDRLDRSKQADEQGLRAVVCERGGVRVRCDDSPHDEAPRPCLRTFHTVS